MDKLTEFYEKVIDIIVWAQDNKHINDEATTILIENINEAKAEMDNF